MSVLNDYNYGASLLNDHDFSYVCRCGVAISSEEAVNGTAYEHEKSDSHMDGLLDKFSDDDWESWVADIDHGLGWAENESMGKGNDDETLGVARALVRRLRRSVRP